MYVRTFCVCVSCAAAMEQYRLAIHHGPKDGPATEHLAVVLTDFGTRLKLAGSTDKAVLSYNEALAVYPAYWSANITPANIRTPASSQRFERPSRSRAH